MLATMNGGVIIVSNILLKADLTLSGIVWFVSMICVRGV